MYEHFDRDDGDDTPSAGEGQASDDAVQDEAASTAQSMQKAGEERDDALIDLFNELAACWGEVTTAKVYLGDDDEPCFFPAWGSDELRELRVVGKKVHQVCEERGPECRAVSDRVRAILEHNVYGPTDRGAYCLLLSDEDCWACHQACKELLGVMAGLFEESERRVEALEVADNVEAAIEERAAALGAPVYGSLRRSEAGESPDETLLSLLNEMDDADSTYRLTHAEVLAFLGIARSTLYGWRSSRGFPDPKKKRYALSDVVKWCRSNDEHYEVNALPSAVMQALEEARQAQEEKHRAEIADEQGRRHADEGRRPDKG